jgi:hypothetical protein
MTALLGWLAVLLVVILWIGVPLLLGRLLADRDRVLEDHERSALEAEALALMIGQPVVDASPDGGEASPPEVSPPEVSPPEVSPADSGAAEGQGSSPM